MTQIPKKPDKPNDPPYPGGEDESPGNETATRDLKQRSNEFPVDESDNGPGTAADGTAAGP